MAQPELLVVKRLAGTLKSRHQNLCLNKKPAVLTIAPKVVLRQGAAGNSSCSQNSRLESIKANFEVNQATDAC